ncbi:hypothetical protein EZS27_005056 [termite gut metagenome]|uniref:Uncharacterized protein n=1 Tax=termite gut metagenome TaxID=433724 RepID=A0A5J4SQ23_9ZZZZ
MGTPCKHLPILIVWMRKREEPTTRFFSFTGKHQQKVLDMDSYPFIPYSICFAQTKPPLVFLSWNIPSLDDKRKNSFRVIFRVGYLESSKTFIIFVLSKLPTIGVSIHFVTHLLPNKRVIYSKSIIINILYVRISLLGLFFTLRCSTLKKPQ